MMSGLAHDTCTTKAVIFYVQCDVYFVVSIESGSDNKSPQKY